jgi:CxxC motif-containing protein
MKELICIVCPKGCHLCVEEDPLTVSGQSCDKGREYAITEMTHPTRVITSTVCVEGGDHVTCPVKTNVPIPKGLIFEAMRTLDDLVLPAPIALGQVVVENICGSGADFIATRAVAAEK